MVQNSQYTTLSAWLHWQLGYNCLLKAYRQAGWQAVHSPRWPRFFVHRHGYWGINKVNPRLRKYAGWQIMSEKSITERAKETQNWIQKEQKASGEGMVESAKIPDQGALRYLP